MTGGGGVILDGFALRLSRQFQRDTKKARRFRWAFLIT
jgi:hypothetical protein